VGNLQPAALAFRLIFSFLLAALFLSCGKNESERIVVKGNLKNLPLGYVVLRALRSDGWHTIDSVSTRDGIFEFNLSAAQYPEPILVGVNHYDSANTRRHIIFSTGVKGKAGVGGIEGASEFYLENGVEMSGSVKVQDIGWYKTIYSSQPIQACRQSRVWYEDTTGFAVTPSINKLLGLIKKHPYSYYYFENLESRAAKLSNDQFYKLFNSFDRDIRESETGTRMKDYIDTRSKYKFTQASVLPDQDGKLQHILDEQAELNLVVLWASWCGLCRGEIPELKKVYQKFAGNEKFRMVSISMDEDPKAWKKAMAYEKMPWKQQLITPEARKYAHELFGYDNRVPLTLL